MSWENQKLDLKGTPMIGNSVSWENTSMFQKLRIEIITMVKKMYYQYRVIMESLIR